MRGNEESPIMIVVALDFVDEADFTTLDSLITLPTVRQIGMLQRSMRPVHTRLLVIGRHVKLALHSSLAGAKVNASFTRLNASRKEVSMFPTCCTRSAQGFQEVALSRRDSAFVGTLGIESTEWVGEGVPFLAPSVFVPSKSSAMVLASFILPFGFECNGNRGCFWSAFSREKHSES